MASGKYPYLREDDAGITVEVCPGDTVKVSPDLEVVLDYDAMGSIIGLEILDLASQAGPAAVDGIAVAAGPACRYDKEADALYLDLGEGRAVASKPFRGRLRLDGHGKLIAVQIPAGGAQRLR